MSDDNTKNKIIVGDWTITTDGMVDHRGYWIAASRYNEVRDGWQSCWIAHLADKSSKVVDLEAFIAAFAQALAVARITPQFDWISSVNRARKRRAANDEYSLVHQEMFPPETSITATSIDEFSKRHDAVEREIARRRGLSKTKVSG